MKVRKYAIFTMLACTCALGLTGRESFAPTTAVYATEEADYELSSEDTIVISDMYDFTRNQDLTKEQLNKITTIIINDSYADLDKLGIFPNAKTLSISATTKGVNFYRRNQEILPSLSDVEVDALNPYFSSKNGVLYSKTGDTLIYYPMGGNPEAKVEANTRVIGEYAFFHVPITSVEIPEGLVCLKAKAFAGTKLETISLPASFRTLSDNTFLDTPLSKVQIPLANKSLRTFDGAIYSKNLTYLYYWPEGKVEENLTFPATLTYLDCSKIKAFHNAKTITIPKAMTAIIHTEDNQLEKICLDEENHTFHMVDGLLYSSTEQNLRLYPNQKPDTEIELSPNLEQLCLDFFYTENTTRTLTLPEKLKEFYGTSQEGKLRLGGFEHLETLNCQKRIRILSWRVEFFITRIKQSLYGSQLS